MNVSEIANRLFWVLPVLVFLLQLRIPLELRERVRSDPEFARRDTRVRTVWVACTLIPWVVMAVGSTTGRVASVRDYIHPEAGRPWVLAFWASGALLWVACAYWIHRRRGARVVVEHVLFPPGFLGEPGDPLEKRSMGVYGVMMLTGMIGAGALMLLDALV